MFYESIRIDVNAMEGVVVARGHAPALGKVRIVSVAEHLTGRLGVDVEGVELPTDRRGPRLDSRNARAVGCCAWLVTSALDLGSVMAREAIEAVRLKTEHDAQLAGEPGAALANFGLLLGTAIRHGGGYRAIFAAQGWGRSCRGRGRQPHQGETQHG